MALREICHLFAEGIPVVRQAVEDKKINEKIQEISEARGVKMATVAIAWVLLKPFITAPILGMSKMDRVDEAISAIMFQLSPAEVNSIDELYAPKMVIEFS